MSGKVQIGMDKFIIAAIDAFPTQLFNTMSMLVGNHLFQVYVDKDKDKKLLLDKQAVLFYHIVTKLIFSTFCIQRDMQILVAFVCMQVKAPDKDDWGKLK